MAVWPLPVLQATSAAVIDVVSFSIFLLFFFFWPCEDKIVKSPSLIGWEISQNNSRGPRARSLKAGGLFQASLQLTVVYAGFFSPLLYFIKVCLFNVFFVLGVRVRVT